MIPYSVVVVDIVDDNMRCVNVNEKRQNVRFFFFFWW